MMGTLIFFHGDSGAIFYHRKSVKKFIMQRQGSVRYLSNFIKAEN